MMNSDDEELTITPPFVTKVELQQFGESDEEEMILDPDYNPISEEGRFRTRENVEVKEEVLTTDEEEEETSQIPKSKWRKKRASEMTPEELEAKRIKWREETRQRRERQRLSRGELAKTKATEATRLRRARMTEEELEERRRKDRERRREKRRQSGRTEAEIQAQRRYDQRKNATKTAEKRAEELQKATIRKLNKLASMTEEELAERKQRRYMSKVARFARKTRAELEEFRQTRNDKQRETYRNMTSEQKEKFLANHKKYYKKRLDNVKEDPEEMNSIRAKVKAINEKIARCPEPGDRPKGRGRPRLPIEVAKEKRRLYALKCRLKRKLMIQDMLDAGMTMEKVKEKLQTPEQRNRRLMGDRIGAAKRQLRKQLNKMGAAPEQIAAKVDELAKSYDKSRVVMCKPRPSRFKRVDRSELAELLEMNPNPVIPVKTEPTPPHSPVNCDVDYDDDDGGEGEHDDDDGGGEGGHEDDYSPTESATFRRSQSQSSASASYANHPTSSSQDTWECISTSSKDVTASTSNPPPPHQPPPAPVMIIERNHKPQPQPLPPPKEYQASSSDSDSDGGAKRHNRPSTSRRTGAGRKDYGPRGGFRKTLQTNKLTTCDECGHAYSETYMVNHKNHFHNKYFVDGKCVLCGKGFRTGKIFYEQHFIKDHKKISKRGKIWRGSRLRNNNKNMTEEELEEWRQTLVVCDLCGNSYTRVNIVSHKRLQHNPHYVDGQCTICNASIVNALSYLAHFRKEHKNTAAPSPKSKFVCEVCGKGFTGKYHLAHHFHHTHGDGTIEENFHKCPICETKFKYKHVMQDHVQKDHPSQVENVIRHHECRHCHQKFRYQPELGEHISAQHPESYFPCLHCNSFRTSKQNLYFHFFVCKKTPKGFVKELGDKNIVPLEKTPLKCEVCEKDVTVYSLKRHYNEVHGVKEDLYPCGECPKMFKMRQYWLNHLDETHGIEFDEELKEKVRKMQVADRTMLEIKEGERCGKQKKSERGKKGINGKPRSRRKKVRSQKVSSDEKELIDKEDDSSEDIETGALKTITRVGTRSRPRIERELPNVEEEKRLVISVVRMSEEEIKNAVRRGNGRLNHFRSTSIASR